MKKQVKSFNDYVVSSLLENNEFGILKVKNLEEFYSCNFDNSVYPQIVALIKVGEFEKIKQSQHNTEATSEYLTIMRFTDQDNESYIVTVYDNDELWQDPQVIDVYKK